MSEVAECVSVLKWQTLANALDSAATPVNVILCRAHSAAFCGLKSPLSHCQLAPYQDRYSTEVCGPDMAVHWLGEMECVLQGRGVQWSSHRAAARSSR